MPEYLKLILFVAAVAVSLYGYIQYGRKVHAKEISPRTFTWLIWGILSTCVAIVQLQNGAAYGAVGAVLGAASGYVLAAMAWAYGSKKIYTTDIVSLTLAAGTFVAWWLFGGLVAVVAATLIYLVGFAPTIIRAWKAPTKESRLPFMTSAFKHGVSLAILGKFTPETMISPIILTVANITFVFMVAARRQKK